MFHNLFRKTTCIFCFLLLTLKADSTGVLKGKIIDIDNQLPLQGANIIIKSTSIGTVSDKDGYFTIENIPNGNYIIVISYIGYKPEYKPDIWIRPNAYDFLNVKLEQAIIEIDDVVVEESFFKKSLLNEFQSVSFNRDDMRRSPGSGQEITRIINTLPSVASVGENRQDMMVRGGGPTENGFIIDNIYIPSISHFKQADGRSNGPVGIINTDMVESLEFYSNGFSSKYGNKLSSFGDINYRTGNREKSAGYGLLGMGGLGFLIEGPINENFSYISSFRMSYLDIIANAINASGGMPSYSDFQSKIDFKPDVYNTYSLLLISGKSLYERDKEGALEVGESEYGKLDNDQITIGINYKKIWSKRSYSNTSFSNSNNYATANFLNISSDSSVFKNIEKIETQTFRQVNHFKVSNQSSLEYGIDMKWENQKYDFLRKLSDNNIMVNEIKFDETVSIANYATFITLKQKLMSQFVSSFGFRIDNNNYEQKTLVSPRINLDYEFINGKTNLILNIGEYYQNPPGIYVANNTSKKLKSINSKQVSLSLEHMITPSTKFLISAYKKNYTNSPALPNSELHNDPTFLFDELKMYNGIESTGKAYSEGIELLIQKKRAENFYGLIGGSFFNSTFTDYNNIERNRNHNYRYVFNAVGGYRPDKNWEVSIRWSYFGGRPYTQINLQSSIQNNEQILNVDNFNNQKTPDYHSLFIRYERRYNLQRSNLILFFEIWNTYNRENIESFFFSKEKKSIEKIVYFSTIPVAGFGIEF